MKKIICEICTFFNFGNCDCDKDCLMKAFSPEDCDKFLRNEDVGFTEEELGIGQDEPEN